MSTNQCLIIFTTKIVSCYCKTLRGEGHSVADWGIGGSVELLLRVQSPFIWAMGGCQLRRAAYCQCWQIPTSNCKPLLFRFTCTWRYIHVGTFNPLFNYKGKIVQYQQLALVPRQSGLRWLSQKSGGNLPLLLPGPRLSSSYIPVASTILQC